MKTKIVATRKWTAILILTLVSFVATAEKDINWNKYFAKGNVVQAKLMQTKVVRNYLKQNKLRLDTVQVWPKPPGQRVSSAGSSPGWTWECDKAVLNINQYDEQGVFKNGVRVVCELSTLVDNSIPERPSSPYLKDCVYDATGAAASVFNTEYAWNQSAGKK